MEKRELKFRFWSDTLKVMYTPESEICNLWSIKEAANGILTTNKDDSLMQYTGLKDMNGKEVYEGDIVYWKHINEYGIVYYNENECHYISKWKNKTESYLDSKKMEIIGNIYENEYLLE